MASLAKIYNVSDSGEKRKKGNDWKKEKQQQSYDTQNRKYADGNAVGVGDIIVRFPMGHGRSIVACVLNNVGEINDMYGANGDRDNGRSLYRSTVCMDGHIFARIEAQRMKRQERKQKQRFASRHDAPFSVGRYKTPYRQPRDEYDDDEEEEEEEYPLDQRGRSNMYYRDVAKLSRNPSTFNTPSISHTSPVRLNRPTKAEGEVWHSRTRDSEIALPSIRNTSPTTVNAQFLPSPREKREARLVLPPIR